jgi:hypothetical protein
MLRSSVVNFVVLTVFSFVTTFGFVGCASNGPRQIDPNYSAYVAAMQAQVMREEKPMVKFDMTDDGKLKGLEVYAPRQIVPIQQKRPDAPHPGWAVANGLVRAATIVGGIWAAGDAMQGILGAASGGGTYIGSNNTNSTLNDTSAWSYNPGSNNSMGGNGTFNQPGNTYSPTGEVVTDGGASGSVSQTTTTSTTDSSGSYNTDYTQ